MSDPLQEEIKKADQANKDKMVGGLAVERLQSLVERIERLEAEKSGLSSDIRDVYAEAKSAGFDTKTLRTVIRLRKMQPSDRNEQDNLITTYRHALDL